MKLKMTMRDKYGDGMDGDGQGDAAVMYEGRLLECVIPACMLLPSTQYTFRLAATNTHGKAVYFATIACTAHVIANVYKRNYLYMICATGVCIHIHIHMHS